MKALSYKIITQEDIANSTTLLHERIPITGTLLAGTYNTSSTTKRELNVKSFAHGMFQSVYDYPYLSSSANHIFDISAGFSANAGSLSSSAPTAKQVSKKVNVYNQMAQVLVGYDTASVLRRFDNDGNLSDDTGKIDNALFFNFSRLLIKDEIKKGSFSMTLGTNTAYATPFETTTTVTDAGSAANFRANSPAGEYGFLKTTAQAASMTISFSNAPTATQVITITAADGTALNFTCHGATTNGAANPPTFSRAGSKNGADHLKTAIEASSISGKVTVSDVSGTGPFTLTVTQNTAGADGNKAVANNLANVSINGGTAAAAGAFRGGVTGDITAGLIYYQAGIIASTSSIFTNTAQIMNNATSSFADVLVKDTVDNLADGVRKRIQKISFSNTTELHSTVYFCRANKGDFNYSSNPTYLKNSKIFVKTNPGVSDEHNLPPVTYITTVGLYSPNNELLAVAKLSEPLRKDPTNELVLRVRLDY